MIYTAFMTKPGATATSSNQYTEQETPLQRVNNCAHRSLEEGQPLSTSESIKIDDFKIESGFTTPPPQTILTSVESTVEKAWQSSSFFMDRFFANGTAPTQERAKPNTNPFDLASRR